jgi:hypothetical protein
MYLFIRRVITETGNYRGISLLPTAYILLPSLAPCVEEITGDHQCGFRRKRSASDNIFSIRQILEKKMGIQ